MPMLTAFLLAATQASAAPPFDLASRTVILSAHAEGAQVYECKAAPGGGLAWAFREPIATLIVDGKTIGRHYAGPHWAFDEGSVVQGKLAGSAPGTTPADIPQLKLDIVAHAGHGLLDNSTAVFRVATKGGALAGGCDAAGVLKAVPYEADYVFVK
jgi:hypothetical protein